MTWKVQVNAKAEREIEDLIKNKILSQDDILVITQWIKFVEKHGPEKLQNNGIWNDHELDRDEKWKGCRSSSFSYSGRIIYKVIDDKIIVEVLRITPDHNYKADKE